MTYTITVMRDGAVIAQRDASAEMVVEFLAEMIGNNPAPQSDEQAKVRRRRGPKSGARESESEEVEKAARRHPATEQIEDMLIDGLTTAAIMERVEVSPPTIGVIRSRLKKEGRLQ